MARVEPNRAGIEAMLRSPMTERALRDIAEKVQARAAQISAVEAVDTGLYAASWRVTTFVDGRGVVARVGNTARNRQPGGNNYPYGVAIEFGYRTRSGRHMPARRILGRALDAARAT